MTIAYVRRTTFTVPASPFGFPGGVTKWMAYCRDQSLGPLRAANLLALREPVKIVGRFFTKPSGHKSDIDNMIKMLIDSLGAGGLFPPSTGGGKKTEWNRDDHWVEAVEVAKAVDAANPRVEVEIWTLAPPSVNTASSC